MSRDWTSDFFLQGCALHFKEASKGERWNVSGIGTNVRFHDGTSQQHDHGNSSTSPGKWISSQKWHPQEQVYQPWSLNSKEAHEIIGSFNYNSDSELNSNNIEACTALHERWQQNQKMWFSNSLVDAEHRLMMTEESYKKIKSQNSLPKAQNPDPSYSHRLLR